MTKLSSASTKQCRHQNFEPARPNTLAWHQHCHPLLWTKGVADGACVILTFKHIYLPHGSRAPSIHPPTARTLNGKEVAPWAMVTMGPGVFCHLQTAPLHIGGQQEYICVTPKLVGLPQHMRKCLFDGKTLDEDNICKSKQEVAGEARLEP